MLALNALLVLSGEGSPDTKLSLPSSSAAMLSTVTHCWTMSFRMAVILLRRAAPLWPLCARLVSDGFAGAMVSDPESTAAGLATIEDLLTGTQAAELSAVLETLWIAGGGAPQLFPRRLGDGGASLSPDRLKLLIEQIPGDFTEFWHRVGTNVGIETFAGLTLRGTQPALQQIMHTALPNLAVRTCRIVHSGRHARTPVRWQVGDGQLYLSGTDREAWLGQKNDDLPRADETASTARPSPQQLLDRFERARLPIVSVQMMRTGRALSLADGHTDIRAEIVPLAATLGEGYVVNRAGTLLEDTKPVTADFVTGTVFGGSVARLSASALLHAAWSVLVDLEEAYRAQIDAAIGRPSPVSWLAVDTSFLLDPVPVVLLDDDLLSDWDTALFTYDQQSLIPRTRRWVSATPLDAEELARVGAVLEQRGELGKAETWYWRAAGAGSRTGRDAARRLLQRWRRIGRVDEAFGTGQIAPAWAEAYAALLNFMAREGHSRVPREHRENAVKLGEWVHQQRRFRDLLTAELETQLEAVPGWTWETNTRDRR